MKPDSVGAPLPPLEGLPHAEMKPSEVSAAKQLYIRFWNVGGVGGTAAVGLPVGVPVGV